MWPIKAKSRPALEYRSLYLPEQLVDRSKPLPVYYIDKNGKSTQLTPQGFEETFYVNYRRHLLFSEDYILDWALKKSSEREANQKIRRMNKWVCALFANEYKAQSAPPLYIKWIDPFLGYGVFAACQIPALTYVGEYVGVVRKRSRRLDRANDYVFGYVVGPNETRYVIDAKEVGNHTRFINHSDEPNLNSRWVIIDGLCHIVFFTNRLIEKGEQLNYDYGPYYWRKRAAPVLC